VNVLTYSSNQILVRIPGYGGPADAIVYTPSSVLTSTSFDTNITVENQNSDIGQDFVVDYWITSDNETTNYSSGQQTIYVGASSTSNITAILTSPSSPGNYRFRSLVTWVGGTATSYDSFEVTAPSVVSETPSQNGGGSSGGGTRVRPIEEITGDVIFDQNKLIQVIEYPDNIIISSEENLTKEFIVKNTGNKTLHNMKITISGLPLGFYSITPNSVDIGVMNTQSYKIVFTPTGDSNKYLFKFIISSDESYNEENSILQVINKDKESTNFFNKINPKVYTLFTVMFVFGILVILLIRTSNKTIKKVFLISFPIILIGINEYFYSDGIISGLISKDLFNYNNLIMIPYLVSLIILFFVFWIILRKYKIKPYVRKQKYAKNTVKGLLKKEVYTSSGHHMGKIMEIIVCKNKIDSLVIKSRKKTKAKGILVKYKEVKSIGQIVIIKCDSVEKFRNLQI